MSDNGGMNPFLATADTLRAAGFAILEPGQWLPWIAADADRLAGMAAHWRHLPPDRYLKDGGHYRFRRHASAIAHPGAATPDQAVERVAHRPHYQPTTYNALHGGILRWFDPIDRGLWEEPAFGALLGMLGKLFAAVRAEPAWYIEAHQFRIDASQEVGKPTPEGAHRDGVDFVALALIERHGVEGGATSLYDNSGQLLLQTTLRTPWTLMLLDDTRVVHETTPVHGTATNAYRDTLVLTYRAKGFMAPEPGQFA
jgi:hypothetical protein